MLATDRDAALLAGLDCRTMPLDVTDDDALRAAVTEAGPDVLFNCAGVVHNGTVLQATEADWDFAFRLNARAQFIAMQAAIPGMLERGGGSIINMASVASSVTGVANRFIYGASKAAVIGMTKSVAMDFVTRGIRCDCICPGTVDSPSLHDRLRATGDYEAAMKAFVARQPMGRIGRPEEIAALAVYLGSDRKKRLWHRTGASDRRRPGDVASSPGVGMAERSAAFAAGLRQGGWRRTPLPSLLAQISPPEAPHPKTRAPPGVRAAPPVALSRRPARCRESRIPGSPAPPSWPSAATWARPRRGWWGRNRPRPAGFPDRYAPRCRR